MVIQPSGGLSKTEIDEMVKNAEAHREEDKEKREAIELKNGLDSKINNVEKSKAEHKDKLSGDIIGELDTAITTAKSAMESEDLEQIKSASEALDAAAMKIGQSVYSQSASQEQT